MKKEAMKISKCFGVVRLVVMILFVAVICGGFSIAYAMPPEPSEEEKEIMREKMESMTDEEKAAFMNERRIEMNRAKRSMEQEETKGSAPEKTETEKKFDEQVDKWIENAKGIFNRNQFRLRIARNVATSTVAQMQLEGTDVKKLREHLQTLENKMTEIEDLYSNYLNKLISFKDGKGDDPGEPSKLFSDARIKKVELMEFYKNTFRGSFEEALIQNEKIKNE